MNTPQLRAILNIMIHASLADGRKSGQERDAVRDAAESLAAGADKALAGVYQDVLLKRVSLADAAAALPALEHRQLAFEMAVCVCDADGVQDSAEQQFLADLKRQLGLEGDAVTTAAAAEADAITAAAYEPTAYGPAAYAAVAALPAAAVAATAATVATVATANAASAAPTPAAVPRTLVNEADLDKTILNSSILNGALELLPQSWASMAIIPLQVRMVYRVGKVYGYELDQGHIKELLATLGVGLTSQYVEQIGRKLVGGLLGKVAGGMIGGLGGAATSMAFSFASTYALGHLAKRYYAGGRLMSTELLRQTYQDLLGSAKATQAQYLPAIQERARTLNAAEVVKLVRQ